MALLIEVNKIIIGEKKENHKRSVKYETELIRADKIESARPYIKNNEIDLPNEDMTLIIMESLSHGPQGRGLYKVHVRESFTSLKKRLKDAGISLLELA